MASAKYHYYGLDYCEMDREERPCYCNFVVKDAKTGEIIVDFYTNRSLEGAFVRLSDGTYRQTRGTCQFTMAGSKSAARYCLRRIAESEITERVRGPQGPTKEAHNEELQEIR